MPHALLLLALFCFAPSQLLASASAPIKLNKIDWENIPEHKIREIYLQEGYNRRLLSYEKLQNAKLYLLFGNTVRAMRELNSIPRSETRLDKVKMRYQAITYFLEGSYQKSFDLLENKELRNYLGLKETCTLRLINSMLLVPQKASNPSALDQRRKELLKEWGLCYDAFSVDTNNNLFWPKALLAIKTGSEDHLLQEKNGSQQTRDFLVNRQIFNTLIQDLETFKLWLKLVVYSNRSEIFEPYLVDVPSEYFKSLQVRELLSLIYYRLGNEKMSYLMIEGVDTPNGDNIRGNLYLKKQQYEIAYGHFRLALQKRPHSLNSLERLLPLAWSLGKWEEGLKPFEAAQDSSALMPEFMRERVGEGTNLSEESFYEPVALQLAFLVRSEKFADAKKIIEQLKDKFKKFDLKLNQIASYTYLMLGDARKSREHALEACKKLDGMNCLLLKHLEMWDNFGVTLKRKEKTSQEAAGLVDGSEIEKNKDLTSDGADNQVNEGPLANTQLFPWTLEELQSKEIPKPLQDKGPVDQKLIEELDFHDEKIGLSLQPK